MRDKYNWKYVCGSNYAKCMEQLKDDVFTNLQKLCDVGLINYSVIDFAGGMGKQR